jgi:uncharacterized membrane protein
MVWIILFFAAGALLAVFGVLGWTCRLPRNWVAGIRTRSALASRQAWRAANRAGAPWMGASGLALLAGAVVMLVQWEAGAPANALSVAGIAGVGLAVVFQLLAWWASARATRHLANAG